MVAKLHFIIDESGEVQVSVEGAVGKACESLTEPFESQLGSIQKRAYKDAYYSQDAQKETMVSDEGNNS